MDKDYRDGQKVIATIEIEDTGQDFIELDVLENGVLLGDSLMFSNGRLSLLGVGSLDGMTYHTLKTFKEVWDKPDQWPLKGLAIYMKETGEKDPLPWKADVLNYHIIGVKKAAKVNRFISKK